MNPGADDINSQVVPDHSSSLTGTELIYIIAANHMEMCRYSRKNDDGYRKVSRELRRLGDSVQKSEEKRDVIENAANENREASC